MARVNIPITDLSIGGVAPPAATTADATNDHELATNDGSVWLEIVSTDGASQNVTIRSQVEPIDGLTLPDRVISVPAGATRLVGRIKPSTHNVKTGADTGKVYIDPAVSATLTFRAYRLPQA